VDSLLSTFPSGYIWDPATWAEARRVLRPGGRFVVVLGGELLPVDHRSRLLIRFHSLVYGDRGAPGATAPPEFPGFRTRLLTRRDARGVAQVLVAEKVADGGPGR
jgi:SAM-dependent methyltransferase